MFLASNFRVYFLFIKKDLKKRENNEKLIRKNAMRCGFHRYR